MEDAAKLAYTEPEPGNDDNSVPKGQAGPSKSKPRAQEGASSHATSSTQSKSAGTSQEPPEPAHDPAKSKSAEADTDKPSAKNKTNKVAIKSSLQRVCSPEKSHRAQIQHPSPVPQQFPDDKETIGSLSHNQLKGFTQYRKFRKNQDAYVDDANEFDAALQSSSLDASKSKLEYHTLRPGFATEDDYYGVRSNHFIVTLPNDTVLYEYRVAGFPQNVTRPKRRVLILDMVEYSQHLWDFRNDFTTDHHSKIISIVPLCRIEDPQPGEEVLQVTVPNYVPGQKNDDPKTLTMSLTFVNKHRYGGLTEYVTGGNESYKDAGAIEAMNIVLAEALSGHDAGCFQVGRNRFYNRSEWTSLQQDDIGKTDNADSAGLVSLRGYVAKLKPGMGAILLNVNTLNSVFYKPKHINEYIDHFQRFGSVTEDDKLFEKMRKHLKGLRVYVDFSRRHADNDPDIDKPNRRVKTLMDIGDLPKRQLFEIADGKQVKVWKHLQDKYGNDVVAAGAHYPCVNVGGTEAKQQKFYLAHQLIVMPDQPYRFTPLPSEVTKAMITAARRDPTANIKAIATRATKSLHTAVLPAMMKKLRMTVSEGIVSVPARKMRGPTIRMRSRDDWHTPVGIQSENKGYFEFPNDAHFIDVRRGLSGNDQAEREAIVQIYTPLKDGSNKDFIGRLYVNLKNQLPSHGIQRIRLLQLDRLFDTVKNWDLASLEERLGKISNQVNLVVVVFTRSNPESRTAYANFKIAADQKCGLKSICFNEGNVKNSYKVPTDKGRKRACQTREIDDYSLSDYVRNIAMKLNLRCGNYNHIVGSAQLPGLDAKTMILVADVTHPGGGSVQGAPSIAAVVASDDADFARYPGSMCLNPPRQESIDQMQRMVYKRLCRWAEKNNDVPSKILFYRDGLGDSQFAKFRHHEVNAVREAHKTLSQQRYPGREYSYSDLQITAVVVTKRHDTRLYPREGAPRRDYNSAGNCVAGTVVDSGITHPYYFDFFLISHNAAQGTAKPAHYFVLENEMNFSPKDLQDTTFNLCHMYGASANAVSYAPPAYYADHLCERGRLYLQPFYENAKEYKGLSEEEVMKKAEKVFYPRGTGEDPWHANHDGKIFWM